MTCPRDSLGRSTCAEFLRLQMAQIGDEPGLGCEVAVSTAPPLVDTGYEQAAYECPHGVVYWIEPTSDQSLRWRERNVR